MNYQLFADNILLHLHLALFNYISRLVFGKVTSFPFPLLLYSLSTDEAYAKHVLTDKL